ncbi:MAG: complexin-2 [Butyrivibrio sp.]|nr:complexin-2 [Butyrivibrio sp.]
MKQQKFRLEVTQAEFVKLIQEAPDGSTLKRVLDRKIDDMVKREMYSDILKATTDAEREEARKAYLDKIGVPISFRW